MNMRYSSIEILPTPIPLSGFGKSLRSARAEETEAHVAEALRLSPRDTSAYMWMTHAGVAKLTLAVTSKRPRAFGGPLRPTEIIRHRHFLLAASLAQLGRLSTRRVPPSRRGLALNPSFAISRASSAWAAIGDHPTPGTWVSA